MPEMLGKIEEVVKETSANPEYAFGTSTSYADVVIWALIRGKFSVEHARCPATSAGSEISAVMLVLSSLLLWLVFVSRRLLLCRCRRHGQGGRKMPCSQCHCGPNQI